MILFRETLDIAFRDCIRFLSNEGHTVSLADNTAIERCVDALVDAVNSETKFFEFARLVKVRRDALLDQVDDDTLANIALSFVNDSIENGFDGSTESFGDAAATLVSAGMLLAAIHDIDVVRVCYDDTVLAFHNDKIK